MVASDWRRRPACDSRWSPVSEPAAELPPEATVASRLASYVRGGGIVTPLITVLLAFFVGGLVVLLTGHNPFSTYKAIFDGTGLNWIFPWAADRDVAAVNLQQTLLATTPLILCGLAVAFAFRCGLFNIGGQGQYQMGAIAAVWVGSSFTGMAHVPHALLAMLAACAAGAVWAGIAGLLKATTGANEVISTIMLNWIAIWFGSYLFGLGGPLQNDRQKSVPVSNDVAASAKLPVFWGDPQLQGLDIGLFIALGALLVFWVILNRTVLGYEVRAVGFNPEAARSAGIPVGRRYVVAMALCGLFAGLGGALDILGWQFRIATNDILISQVGFIGIAVALLGRNTAVGVLFAALLFGGLETGTSVRNLDPSVFDPALATNLTFIIQGLVVLIVSTDVLVVYLWRLRRRWRREPADAAQPAVVEVQ
jgi:general nucleoside transport system permease protein